MAKKRKISILKNSQRQWELFIYRPNIQSLALRKMHFKSARKKHLLGSSTCNEIVL